MSDTPVKKDAVLDKEKTEVPAKTAPKEKQVQIHAGNIPVVTCQLLSELNVNIARIARCAEIWIKETYPHRIKPKAAKPPEKPKEPDNG